MYYSNPEECIKINLPLTEQDYMSGNGEGVWVKVDPATRQAHDFDKIGPGYFGILTNDSLYYPGLVCDAVIPFEMRGENRPVADFPGFLSQLPRLTLEAKGRLLREIAEHPHSAIWPPRQESPDDRE